jgi:hypothetical protein
MELELKQVDLEEMNSALKVLLDKREEDRPIWRTSSSRTSRLACFRTSRN